VAVIGALVDVGELLPRRHVDAGRVAGERDLAGEERAVVVAVVPRESPLVEHFLPQQVLNFTPRRVLAVEHDRAAVLRTSSPPHIHTIG
jgi:hypothetical protein